MSLVPLDPLSQLIATFTTVNPEYLQCLLSEVEGNTDIVLDFLLQPRPTGPPEGTTQRPCRHFLEGHCARRDCLFLHDISTCSFWKNGTCYKGEHCSFLHELDDKEKQRLQEVQKTYSRTPFHSLIAFN